MTLQINDNFSLTSGDVSKLQKMMVESGTYTFFPMFMVYPYLSSDNEAANEFDTYGVETKQDLVDFMLDFKDKSDSQPSVQNDSSQNGNV